MSKYTIELGKLIESGYPLPLNNYPIFSESHRNVLNRKIIDHYYFREIGLETADRFSFFLKRKMNEIMPYYNEMYMSTLIAYDPLATEYFTENVKEDRKNSATKDGKLQQKTGEEIGQVETYNKDFGREYGLTGTHVEGVITDYTKQGDSNNLRTDDLTETIAEDTKFDQLTTNDLHTKTVTDSTAEGTTKKTSSETQVFSDIPQAGYETTRTIAPDGTVTETAKGYATTKTDVSGSENTNSTTKEHGQSDTDNTGTVKVESTTDRDQTKRNTGTVNTDEVWHENGKSNKDTAYKETEDTTTKENEKYDNQTNRNRDEKIEQSKKERNESVENADTITNTKGRRGVSPAQLILNYRKTIVNIDMQIIEELEPLFMGVY